MGDERYIGIDLAGAIAHPGSEQWDVVLQDGDHLIIPQQNNTVSINGEVLYPNTVTYKDGASLDYYIDQAGGYGEKARKTRVCHSDERYGHQSKIGKRHFARMRNHRSDEERA